MTHPRASRDQMFRVWIVRLCLSDWRPTQWNDVPPAAAALEPAEANCLTYDETAAVIEGFNRRMLVTQSPLWTVAVPVTLRFDGDPHPGGMVSGHQLASIENRGNAVQNRRGLAHFTKSSE